jgi:hypothetical protein
MHMIWHHHKRGKPMQLPILCQPQGVDHRSGDERVLQPLRPGGGLIEDTVDAAEGLTGGLFAGARA